MNQQGARFDFVLLLASVDLDVDETLHGNSS
jgi:hypothetical protein